MGRINQAIFKPLKITHIQKQQLEIIWKLIGNYKIQNVENTVNNGNLQEGIYFRYCFFYYLKTLKKCVFCFAKKY